MERYVTWYILQLKAWCRKKTCWLQIAGMCLLLAIVMSIAIPAQNNCFVGICNIQGHDAEKMVNILEDSDSIFEFRRYTDEAEMRQDILSGKIECGFSFSEDFQEKLGTLDVENCLSYIETSFSTKGKVARETVYTAFLQILGEQILKESLDDIYGSYDEELLKELLAKNQEYLDSDQVFQIKEQRVETVANGSTSSDQTYPIQGLIGLFLFGIMFLEHGRKFEPEKRRVLAVLTPKEQCIFQVLGSFAVVSIAAFVGLIWIFCSSASRGTGIEILFMVLYLLYCWLWIWVIGRLFQSQTTFMVWTVTMIVIQMLICPVFIDLSVYIQALDYIKYLFPLGIYI